MKDKELFNWYFHKQLTPYYSVVYLPERWKEYCHELPWLWDLDRRILSGEMAAVGKVHIIFGDCFEPTEKNLIEYWEYKNEMKSVL